MFKIILIAVLLLNSIFWGLYPISDNSPHNYLLNIFNINIHVNKYHHIFIGTCLYIITTFISHYY